jgi:hypothetical protein
MHRRGPRAPATNLLRAHGSARRAIWRLVPVRTSRKSYCGSIALRLRISEAVRLMAAAIDSARMVVRVEQGIRSQGSVRDAVAHAAGDSAQLRGNHDGHRAQGPCRAGRQQSERGSRSATLKSRRSICPTIPSTATDVPDQEKSLQKERLTYLFMDMPKFAAICEPCLPRWHARGPTPVAAEEPMVLSLA